MMTKWSYDGGTRCEVCTYCKLVGILERIDATDAEYVPARFRWDGILNEQRRAQHVNMLGKEVLIRVHDIFAAITDEWWDLQSSLNFMVIKKQVWIKSEFSILLPG